MSANGRQIEQRFLEPPSGKAGVISILGFAEERPTQADWSNWAHFWTPYTLPGLYLITSLGKCIAGTYRQWDWFYDKDADVLERQIAGGVEYYMRSGLGRTRASHDYIRTVTHADGCIPAGLSCTVITADSSPTASLVFSGPPLIKDPSQPESFFTFLKQWGGLDVDRCHK